MLTWWLWAVRLRLPLQLLVSTGLELAVLPFWAVKATSALLTELQRFLEFSSKPLWPLKWLGL